MLTILEFSNLTNTPVEAWLAIASQPKHLRPFTLLHADLIAGKHLQDVRIYPDEIEPIILDLPVISVEQVKMIEPQADADLDLAIGDRRFISYNDLAKFSSFVGESTPSKSPFD